MQTSYFDFTPPRLAKLRYTESVRNEEEKQRLLLAVTHGHVCGSQRVCRQTQQLPPLTKSPGSTTTENLPQIYKLSPQQVFAFANTNHLNPSLPFQLCTCMPQCGPHHQPPRQLAHHRRTHQHPGPLLMGLDHTWCLLAPLSPPLDSLSSCAPAHSQPNPCHWPPLQCVCSEGDCEATCECTDPSACRPRAGPAFCYGWHHRANL